MAKSHLKLITPATIKRKVVTSRRPKNADLRTREYLTAAETEKLIGAAKDNRYGHRNTSMILIAYRHGLRATEPCQLEWSQPDFASGTLHVRRVK